MVEHPIALNYPWYKAFLVISPNTLKNLNFFFRFQSKLQKMNVAELKQAKKIAEFNIEYMKRKLAAMNVSTSQGLLFLQLYNRF